MATSFTAASRYRADGSGFHGQIIVSGCIGRTCIGSAESIMGELLGGLAIFLAAVALTAWVRKYALKAHLLDYPNQRSSHTLPTPRGGGLGIVITSLAAAVALWAFGKVDTGLMLAFVGGGAAIASVGFMDDRGSVPVVTRFTVHVVAAVWALYWLGGLPPLQVGARLVDLGWLGHGLAVLGLVWALNLFNFMDGIDGLAGSEAACIGLLAGGLFLWLQQSTGASLLAMSVGLAALGFLVWNWPPAKIFMGDVGSGYLGFVIAVLAVAEARANPVALFIWLILAAVFFVDATVTLVRRWRRGERVYEAHRTHAYQWLSRRWNSHLRVTLAVVGVNLGALLPCAVFALVYPQFAGWAALLAVGALSVVALWCGAGRAP
jgi:Fuc2NAc and GlcNAc transferase